MILATLPLIALGVLGVAFAAFQISIARMNRLVPFTGGMRCRELIARV